MECGYCDDPILEGESYIYKWFPDKGEAGKMLRVHTKHIEGTRNMKKATPYVGQ